MTGMITKTVETIGNLPAVNKIAYRRHLLEKCVTVKETIEEFDGYLQIALAKGMDAMELDGQKKKEEVTVDDVDNDDDEEEDDEDDEDEREYTSEEYHLVSKTVSLFKVILDLLKVTMNLITEVGDRINDETVAIAEENNTKTRKELQATSDLWIGKIVYQVDQIEGAVIDTGAELYPPVSREESVHLSETLYSEVETLFKQLEEGQKTFSSFISSDKLALVEKYKASLASLR